MLKGSNASEGRMYFLLFIVIIVWGLSWPVNKLGLAFVPPFWFAAFRLLFATITMFLLATFTKKLIFPSKKDLPLILSLGIFQIGIFILLINLGLEFQESGKAAILVYTTPLWVMPMAIFFFKEPSTTLKWVGFWLGVIGVLCMLNPMEINWTNSKAILGILFLMGASLSFSISILCARYMTWHHTPLELISWQLLLGSLLLISVALFAQPHPNIQWNLTSIGCLVYTAVAATAFGFFGMSKVSKEFPATVTSISLLGVPASGVLFSLMILHEQIDILMIISLLFICVGVVCVIAYPRGSDGGSKLTR